MKIIIFCLIAITLISSTSFTSSEAPSDKKQSASPQYKCKGTALCISGKVIKIVDGDTIYLKDYKIRLSLTDTPEKGKKGFKDATYFTKKLCPLGSIITVDQDDNQPYDKYKRVVGKVTCSGKVLNSELLYNGHASILKKYCSKSEFSSEPWAKKFGCTQTVQMKENKQPSQSPTTVPPTPTKENNCDPSYPDVCIPPWPPDLDCDGIPYRNFKVLPPDTHYFDGDQDGIGCEKSTSSQPPTSVPPTPTKENRCDPSYPTVCIPPPPPDLDCGDIEYSNFKVLPPDPHYFDGDKDGIGCEKSTSSQPPTSVPPTPTKDSDFDGIPDSYDACPFDRESINGYLDEDGCPDEIPKESQTPTPTKENQCDPSYPDVCIPPYPPDLDCGDIPYSNFRVLPPDPHRFDGDKDGIGCEK